MKRLKVMVIIMLSLICIRTIIAQQGSMDWTQATANAGWSARYCHTSLVYDNKMWIIGGNDGSNKNDVWYSSNGISWTQATANAGWSARYHHTSVVFDNKMWVIGGHSAASDVWYSSDGVTWTRATASAGWSAREGHSSVVFDNKMWVIGGGTSDVWYSPDGVNWTQATANAGWTARHNHISLVFDNKMWVMGGHTGSGNRMNDVWYSTDGVIWTQATTHAGWTVRSGHTSVIYDNKMWVFGGGYNDYTFTNDVWYSSDGVNWTQAMANAGWLARYYHTSLISGNKIWVIGGSTGSLKNDVWYSMNNTVSLFSPNGGEFWAGASNQIIKWRTNASGFARYRLLLSRNSGSTYTDTIAHNISPSETTYSWFVPIINNNTCRMMVQVLDSSGTVVVQDASDANFTIRTLPMVVLPNGGEFWAGASNQIIKWRTVGTGFARYRLLLSRNSGSTYTDTIVHNISPSETTYNWLVPSLNLNTCRVNVQILDSSNNVISEDASDANFTIDSEQPGAFSLVLPLNGAWASGSPLFSWTTASDNFGISRYQLFIDGSLRLDSIQITSTLAELWACATANAGWSARVNHTSVVFNNKIWVMGGYDASGRKNDVWYSSDGVTWTQAIANASWSARQCPTSVVFDNKMWVMGGDDVSGYKRDVWYSTDGVTWTQATATAGWSARVNHKSVVFDNKMWVIGGHDGSYKRDVWYSTDGVTWTQATATAGWSVRSNHTSVVFDNKMWIMGGYDGSRKRDVWYSTDGANWTQATASAGWSARRYHTSVVYDNKIWVIGGDDGSRKRDVWYSTDGINWTQATVNAGWSARDLHTSVVFDDKMWVIGGNDGSYKRDVWYAFPKLLSLPEGWRTWFVRAIDKAGNWRQSTQTWSVQIDTISPASFNLTSPSDSIWTIGSGITFNWGSSFDAGSGLSKYQLWIDGNLNRDNIASTQTSTTNIGTLSSGMHTWYIKAIDSVGNARISNQTRVLRVYRTFNLSSPANLSWTSQRRPKFIWQAMTDSGFGTSFYQLYIDGQLNVDSILSPDTSAYASTSLNDGQHLWYILAYNNSGSFICSQDTYRLNIDSTPPISFNLVSPSDSAYRNIPTPTLIWQKSSDAGIGFRKYQLWIDNAVNFDSLGQNDTTVAPATPLSQGYHTWYVKAFDQFNNARNSNQTWTVIMDFNPPDTFSLVQPSDNETTYVQQPRFYWRPTSDAISGIKKYQLLINGIVNIDSIPATDSSAIPVSPLPNYGTYTWSIRVFDKAGNFRLSNQTWYITVIIDSVAPSIPTLISPVNGFISQDTLPRFWWRRSNDSYSGIDHYVLVYSPDSTFASGVVINITDTCFQVPTRLTDSTYYWCVEAVDRAGNYSNWSFTWHFEIDTRVPNSPVLISPLNGQWSTNTSVIFHWSQVTFDAKSPVRYLLQVDTSRNFTNPIIDTTNLLYDTLVLNQAQYFWRVRAYDLAGNQGIFSGQDSFGIDITAPSVPNLVSPMNGAMINNPNVTFVWNRSSDNSSGVSRYTLQGSIDPLFILSLDTIVTDTTITITLVDTTFYWRVKAHDRAGNQSNWSSACSFELDTEIPNAPVLISPINGQWSTNTSVIFHWSQVTFNAKSPVRYLLQVDTSRNFTNPIVDTTNLLYDTFALNQARYFWRVRAYDLAGNQGTFSGMDSFGIDNTAPSIPNLVSPANGAMLNDSFVRFYWNRSSDNVSGARNYRIQIACNYNFTSSFDTTIIDTTMQRKLRDSTYYWRIKAIDRANNESNWSNTRDFSIHTTGIEENTIIGPKHLMFDVYPNPAKSIFNICFSLPTQSEISLSVYDGSGKLVKVLYNGNKQSGNYVIKWNGENEYGKKVSQGIYFYTLKVNGKNLQKKVMLLR